MSDAAANDAVQGAGWNIEVARAFFESAGKPESVVAGTVFFAEQQKANRLLFKRDRMYLLLEGDVALSSNGRALHPVLAGGIFGEMASISHTPRSATATAKSACRVIALDDRQFQQALRAKPEFALMLMHLMIVRLREVVTQLVDRDVLPAEAAVKEAVVFEPKLLAELKGELAATPPVFYDAKKVILREGQAGILMYVVLEGRVAIRVGGAVLERVGPGGVFGEMALIDAAPRAASAVAEAECSLLAIDRRTFLALMATKPAFGVSLLTAAAERAGYMAARLR